MTTKKPSNEEEEYFAKEEANRLHQLAVEKKRQTERAEQERLKQLHFMHCPKCGFHLDTIAFKGVAIDRCFHCGGTWLDQGELEQLAGRESNVLSQILALFTGHKA
ncbi:MAG TPA: zf-TFIIB domain-containing protein [Polyangia bacterium]|jgi:hypothetical protein